MSLIQPIIKEINSNITNLEGLSYNDNDLNLKKLQEFYNTWAGSYKPLVCRFNYERFR